jgi:L-alanine-DL-glutamate epimerase-like enolase superfamily enzyme
MKITDVTTIKLTYRMDRAMADAIHYMPARPALLVQVHTDAGITGLGEAAAYGGSLESMLAVIGDLRRPCWAKIPSQSSGSGARWRPRRISAAVAAC